MLKVINTSGNCCNAGRLKAERQTPIMYGKAVPGAEAPEIYTLPRPHSEHFIWPPK